MTFNPIRSVARRTRQWIYDWTHWARRGPPPQMAANPRFDRYRIGSYSYGAPKIYDWGDGGDLAIGNYCSIAEGVTILLGGNHHPEWISTFPFNFTFDAARNIRGQPYSKGPVVIGHDVWIGFGATILSGVTIGNGAVIAARSVVTKDVAPYSIVAGNPAKHIKFRFSPETIEALEKSAWWNWSPDRVGREAARLMKPPEESLAGWK